MAITRRPASRGLKNYRKVLIVGGTILLSFAALMFAKLTGDNFTVIATAGISAFSIANAVEHRSGSGS